MSQKTRKFEAGDQMRYVYTFHGMAPIVQYVRSHAEAEAWAETYKNSTAYTGGLLSWYKAE